MPLPPAEPARAAPDGRRHAACRSLLQNLSLIAASGAPPVPLARDAACSLTSSSLGRRPLQATKPPSERLQSRPSSIPIGLCSNGSAFSVWASVSGGLSPGNTDKLSARRTGGDIQSRNMADVVARIGSDCAQLVRCCFQCDRMDGLRRMRRRCAHPSACPAVLENASAIRVASGWQCRPCAEATARLMNDVTLEVLNALESEGSYRPNECPSLDGRKRSRDPSTRVSVDQHRLVANPSGNLHVRAMSFHGQIFI